MREKDSYIHTVLELLYATENTVDMSSLVYTEDVTRGTVVVGAVLEVSDSFLLAESLQ